MRTVLVLALFTGTIGTFAQSSFDLSSMKYEGDEAIHVEKLASDSLASSFVIWIKEGVKAHFHAEHTEYVYIISGKGTMVLGDQTLTIHPGMLIYIPSETLHSATVTSDEVLKVLSVQTPEFKGKDRIFVRPYMDPSSK